MEKVIIGVHTLYHGDAYEIAPSLGFVDCMVTDPPYEFAASGGGMFRDNRKNMDDIIESGLDKGFDHKILNTLLYKSVFVFCHNAQLYKLLPFLTGNYSRAVVLAWHKNNPMPVANKNYLPDTEFYIHAWNDGGYPLGEICDKKRHITTNNGKSEYDHPTVKPQAVMEKIMCNVNGNSVIDPFMGTGSTGIAAIKHGKSFTGIEHNKKYFDIACERIEKALN